MIPHYTKEMLQKIYAVDAEFIGVAFLISEKIGMLAMEMTIRNFQNLLYPRSENRILSTDIEYRTYLLRLLEGIREKIEDDYHKHLVTEYIIELYAKRVNKI